MFGIGSSIINSYSTYTRPGPHPSLTHLRETERELQTACQLSREQENSRDCVSILLCSYLKHMKEAKGYPHEEKKRTSKNRMNSKIHEMK